LYIVCLSEHWSVSLGLCCSLDCDYMLDVHCLSWSVSVMHCCIYGAKEMHRTSMLIQRKTHQDYRQNTQRQSRRECLHVGHHITRICGPFCTSSTFSRLRDIATSSFHIQWCYHDRIELKDINCVWGRHFWESMFNCFG